jgi:electron transport complex protein RnfA
MEIMRNMMFILMSMVLVDNLVLAKFLGICPFLGVSKKMDSAIGMSFAVISVMVLATAVTWPIYTYFLAAYGIEYLQTIVFILVIASLVQLIEMALKKYIPALHQGLGVYLPLITTNCAVLGIAILNIDNGYDFLQSIVNAFGGGLGFLLAMVLFSGVRRHIEGCDIPLAFRGIPATLIAASILAISFMGFTGVVDGIFL